MILSSNIGFVVLVSIIVFLVIIIALVGILMYVKDKLTSQENVTIIINDNKKLNVTPGSSLLSTLSNEKIFLPSACGGGGTCAMCKCQVISGGGSILPTEKPYFTRKQIQDNWRLGCQVKVRENMEISVHPEILDIKKWDCEVISNNNVATYIKELIVKLPEGEKLNFKSGGYIQIDVPQCEVNYSDFDIEEEYRQEWTQNNLWDLKMKNSEETFRAYSMANHPAEGNIVMLNIRIATPPWDSKNKRFLKVNPGVCSSYVFNLKKGDKIKISGPYGEFFLKDTNNEMMFIGGGAGMAPMRSHLFHLFHTLKTNRKVTFWYGARSVREMFYIDEFKAIEKHFPNFKFHVALSDPKPEDNWTGYTGYIHNIIINEYLSKHKEPEEIEYYLCGPPIMNKAIEKMIYDFGIPSEMLMYDDFG